MKYLLFYFAFVPFGSTGCGVTCNTSYQGPSQWTAELKNSKVECMDALKKLLDPTKAWCIPVNGYTNELIPY